MVKIFDLQHFFSFLPRKAPYKIHFLAFLHKKTKNSRAFRSKGEVKVAGFPLLMNRASCFGQCFKQQKTSFFPLLATHKASILYLQSIYYLLNSFFAVSFSLCKLLHTASQAVGKSENLPKVAAAPKKKAEASPNPGASL